jgi:hypothetical protein
LVGNPVEISVGGYLLWRLTLPLKFPFPSVGVIVEQVPPPSLIEKAVGVATALEPSEKKLH